MVKNGLGQFRYKNGIIIEGEFKNDLLIKKIDLPKSKVTTPMQPLSTFNIKDAASIYLTTTESSVTDFNTVFNPIETLTFTGKKLKKTTSPFMNSIL